jgi:hypothetical protein
MELPPALVEDGYENFVCAELSTRGAPQQCCSIIEYWVAVCPIGARVEEQLLVKHAWQAYVSIRQHTSAYVSMREHA